ncbi:MAG: MFS transporter [Fibrobacter sp.]|nr:MFS transporter [Fibrobacter sp.]
MPRSLTLMLAVMAGVSVANIYYCQPLLNMIRQDMAVSEFYVNLMPVLTQVGYALGLLFIVPLGDMINRRRIVLVNFSLLIFGLMAIYAAPNVHLLLVGSFVTGVCSVTPQIFMPMVSLFSKPEEKELKTGMVLSGLLTGILASRVCSGLVGEWLGWRAMFLIAAAMMLVSTMVVYKALPNVPVTYRGTFFSMLKSIGELFVKFPKARVYSIRSGFAFGSFLALWACLAFRMKQAPFYQDSKTVGLLGLCGIAGALTASRIGKYIARYGVERFSNGGVALMISAWAMFYFGGSSYVAIIAGIIAIDIGMQFIQLGNQSSVMRLYPEATSRMNTIFMTTYFVGGSLGTFLAGSFWTLWGWNGTVLAGVSLALASFMTTLITKKS